MSFTETASKNAKTKFYNTDDIISIIQTNLMDIINNDTGYYQKCKYKISHEQFYVSDEERRIEKDTIFIVVKLMNATLDFNQVIIPFTLTALCEKNNVDVVQKLFLEYAQAFNLTDGSGSNTSGTSTQTFMYKQTYDTPVYTSHFNEVYDGFRSICTLTGNILINYSVYPIKSITYYPGGFSNTTSPNTPYEIKTLTNAFAYSNTPDSQAYSGKNRTESINRYGTLSLSFTCYSENNSFIKECIQMSLQQSDRASNGNSNVFVNREFCFKITFQDSSDISYNLTLKLNDFNYSQAIGQFPTVTVSFIE